MSASDSVNPNLQRAQYAVRGAIVQRAAEISEQLESGHDNFNFDKILYCNVGNPQSLGQKPLTFPRQVLVCWEYPEMLQNEAVAAQFPADVKERAQQLTQALQPGAYTPSTGSPHLRKVVAGAIERRDGHACDPESVLLTDGASQSVHALFRTIISGPIDAFLVPIPQYPLYSAALTLYNGTMLPYYLDEDADWGIDTAGIAKAVANAERDGLWVRGIVVINPGNPTGQVLDYDNLVDIVKLCEQMGMAIIADEVYQENVWEPGKTFTSMKKVVCDTGASVTLYSMHSISKGFLGECGHRGGYMELHNVPDKVLVQLKKLLSINLCSNTVGQVLVSLMMTPPQPGDPSFELYKQERDSTLASLKRRAVKLSEALRGLEGISCTGPHGALYVFPKIDLPPAAIKAADEQGLSPDFLYCKTLLEEAGIVVVPGSGFRQKTGTFHFRTTILPPEETIDEVIESFSVFHKRFMAKYAAAD